MYKLLLFSVYVFLNIIKDQITLTSNILLKCLSITLKEPSQNVRCSLTLPVSWVWLVKDVKMDVCACVCVKFPPQSMVSTAGSL